jgi:hypothetical protein
MFSFRAAVPVVLVGAISLVGTACQDVVAPEISPDDRVAADRTTDPGAQQVGGWSIAHEFARVAREEVPGFGGYYLDETGRVNIQLKNPGQRDRALAALSRAFARDRAHGGRGGPDVANHRVIQARYDYIELKGWRDRARELFGMKGLHLLEIDDVRNRVRLIVDGEASRSSFRAQLAMLGIPAEAVIVEIGDPVVSETFFELGEPTITPQNMPVDGGGSGGGGSTAAKTLQDPYRPLVGGLEIWYVGRNGLNYPCTYGANVRENSYYALQFVTASHCSRQSGIADGTPFTQGHFENEASIGYEREDPPFSGSPQASGTPCHASTCRYSDMSVAVLQDNNYKFGEIAKTSFSHQYDGSKVISGRFKITAQLWIPLAPPAYGMQFDKVGAATGWTTGAVTNPCADVTVTRDGFLYGFFCQTIVNAGAAGGDSGAPVFRRWGSDDVTFYGILWGGTATTFTFSTVFGMANDGIGIDAVSEN